MGHPVHLTLQIQVGVAVLRSHRRKTARQMRARAAVGLPRDSPTGGRRRRDALRRRRKFAGFCGNTKSGSATFKLVAFGEVPIRFVCARALLRPRRRNSVERYLGAYIMAAAAPKTLSASSVPGSLSAKDREVVADGFNALRNNNPQPSPASGLRIVDLLDSRFIFTVTHPRPLNAAAFRALALKLKTVRKVTLDLPRNAARRRVLARNAAAGPRRRRRKTQRKTQEGRGAGRTAAAGA